MAGVRYRMPASGAGSMVAQCCIASFRDFTELQAKRRVNRWKRAEELSPIVARSALLRVARRCLGDWPSGWLELHSIPLLPSRLRHAASARNRGHGDS